MEVSMFLQVLLFSTLVLGFFARLYVSLVINPKRIRKILNQQGIAGPTPQFLLGNLLEIKKSRQESSENVRVIASHDQKPPVKHDTASVLPFLEHWRKEYGQVYTFALGKLQVLYVSSPNLVKEIITSTSFDLGRPSYQQKELGPLLGQGILTSNGEVWARQRKIMAPELFMDKVKGMIGIITESALAVVSSWNEEVRNHGGVFADIAVDGYMKQFSGSIISKACFGSSYSKGQEIFSKLETLQKLMSEKNLSFGIPWLRYLPTKSNRRVWALENEVRALILKVVKEKKENRSGRQDKDLLQTLLENAKGIYHSDDSSDSEAAVDQFIVDNCRNIYLAGSETSAVSASWCLMLLASNQEWQARVRDEVREVCGGQNPNIDMLRKMKLLHMVIQETMRLYPPAPTLAREALKDMKIGDVTIPKGVNLWTMVATLHTDKAIWGEDALEFRPQRFENGIAGACKGGLSNCYLPFGFGRRVCIGQHLAMVELKLLMCLILSNFSFALSPRYVHSPVMTMIIEPRNGVRIVVQKL